jgi:hypothetical protein
MSILRPSPVLALTGILTGLLLVTACTAGGLETESPPPPLSGPEDSTVSESISGTYTGTHTVELGKPPEDATHIRTDLTCLSPGALTLDDGTVVICPTTSVATSSMTSYELLPGQHSVTVTAAESSTRYTVSVVYEDGESVR